MTRSLTPLFCLAVLLAACVPPGILIDPGPGAGAGDDDDSEEAFPWVGRYLGGIVLIAEGDQGDWEFCLGEVAVEVDAGGELSGEGACTLQFDGPGGQPPTMSLVFDGQVSATGEVANGRVEQTFSRRPDNPWDASVEGEFSADGEQPAIMTLVWESSLRLMGGIDLQYQGEAAGSSTPED
jgi:hypothetical protein